MAQSRFRWTLTNEGDSSTEVLTRDPVGWEDVELKIRRHPEYKGVFVDWSLDLAFHCAGGGKEFIDEAYQTEDVNANISILIEMACDQTGSFSELYSGKINMPTYQTDGEFTRVNIIRSDLYDKLLSRDDVKVNMEQALSIGEQAITPATTAIIPMDGQELFREAEWVIPEGYVWSRIVAFSDPFISSFFVPAAVVGDSDYQTVNALAEFSNFAIPPESNTTFQRTPVPHMLDLNMDSSEYPLTLDYEIHIEVDYSDNQTTVGNNRNCTGFVLNLYYGKLDDPNIVPNTETLYSIPGGYTQEPYTDTIFINQTGQITLNAGDAVTLAWRIEWEYFDDVTQHIQFSYRRSTIRFFSNSVYQPTEAKSVLIHEAFNQVVDSIADADGKLRSEFYGRTDSQKEDYAQDGCGSLLAISNGLNIREKPDTPIFCSLQELFRSANALHNIGLGLEDDGSGNEIVRIEPLSYFFDGSTQTLSLQRPVKVEVRNDNSRYFNKQTFGYKRWETEFNRGLDEPCTIHEYSTRVQSIKNEYKAISDYLASSYAIELTRRKNIALTEDDWRYDNENFFIALLRSTGGYADVFLPEKYVDSFTNGSGMEALTTAFNLRLTPGRMLQAHFANIVAGLQIIQGNIKFTRGDGNTELAVAMDDNGCQETYSGNILGENDDLAFNEASVINNTPIWLPERYKFDYPLTNSQLQDIRTNPHGYIQFLDDHGNTRKGFIIDVTFKLKTGLTTFELVKMYEP